ncbi:MAG: hypothetical protein IJU00_13540 [Selenomonas sp.]|nr:hypothetical protein [Selenomonas sp.]
MADFMEFSILLGVPEGHNAACMLTFPLGPKLHQYATLVLFIVNNVITSQSGHRGCGKSGNGVEAGTGYMEVGNSAGCVVNEVDCITYL